MIPDHTGYYFHKCKRAAVWTVNGRLRCTRHASGKHFESIRKPLVEGVEK
jgi:hypothetical protein